MEMTATWRVPASGTPVAIPELFFQTVQLEFLTQGIAVDAKHVRGFALVAPDVFHDDFKQWTFHFVNHHGVQIAVWFLAIEIVEITLKRASHASCKWAFACVMFFHAARPASARSA